MMAAEEFRRAKWPWGACMQELQPPGTENGEVTVITEASPHKLHEPVPKKLPAALAARLAKRGIVTQVSIPSCRPGGRAWGSRCSCCAMPANTPADSRRPAASPGR